MHICTSQSCSLSVVLYSLQILVCVSTSNVYLSFMVLVLCLPNLFIVHASVLIPFTSKVRYSRYSPTLCVRHLCIDTGNARFVRCLTNLRRQHSMLGMREFPTGILSSKRACLLTATLLFHGVCGAWNVPQDFA